MHIHINTQIRNTHPSSASLCSWLVTYDPELLRNAESAACKIITAHDTHISHGLHKNYNLYKNHTLPNDNIYPQHNGAIIKELDVISHHDDEESLTIELLLDGLP